MKKKSILTILVLIMIVGSLFFFRVEQHVEEGYTVSAFSRLDEDMEVKVNFVLERRDPLLGNWEVGGYEKSQVRYSVSVSISGTNIKSQKDINIYIKYKYGSKEYIWASIQTSITGNTYSYTSNYESITTHLSRVGISETYGSYTVYYYVSFDIVGYGSISNLPIHCQLGWTQFKTITYKYWTWSWFYKYANYYSIGVGSLEGGSLSYLQSNDGVSMAFRTGGGNIIRVDFRFPIPDNNFYVQWEAYASDGPDTVHIKLKNTAGSFVEVYSKDIGKVQWVSGSSGLHSVSTYHYGSYVWVRFETTTLAWFGHLVYIDYLWLKYEWKKYSSWIEWIYSPLTLIVAVATMGGLYLWEKRK